jgi:hypothetical protein
MSDKRSLLEAQIQALKDIIKTLENTHPDELSKKWRIKVFEEMMRNKQQQLAHSLELRRAAEDIRRLQGSTEELRTNVQRYQANATQLMQDNEVLQQRLAAERQERGVLASIQKQQNVLLLGIPPHLQGQCEVMTEISTKLGRYQQRIGTCQAQIRAVKRLNNRERAANYRQIRDLTAENESLKTQARIAISLAAEVESSKRVIEDLQSRYQQLSRDKTEAEMGLRAVMEEKEAKWKEAVAAEELKQRLLHAEIEKIKAENKDYQTEIERLKTIQKTSEDLITSRNLENDKLRSLISDQKAAFQNDFQRLSDDLNSQIESERLKHESEFEALRIELTRRDIDSSTLIEKLEADIEELRTETLALERSNKELKRERSLLVSSMKTSERKMLPHTQSREVQTTVLEPARPVATLKSRWDEVEALGRDLLDTP